MNTQSGSRRPHVGTNRPSSAYQRVAVLTSAAMVAAGAMLTAAAPAVAATAGIDNPSLSPISVHENHARSPGTLPGLTSRDLSGYDAGALGPSGSHPVSQRRGGTLPPTTPVGIFPISGVRDHSTHTLYVTNGGVNTISMIDTARCNATRSPSCGHAAPTVTVGDFPIGIAVNQATHTVYVGVASANAVSVIDTTTCNSTASSGCAPPHPTVAVGEFPDAVTVDQDTDTVYVANQNSGTLSVIDGATCNATVRSGCTQTAATIRVGNGPGSIAVDDVTHTLYEANFNDGTVSMVDAATCNAKVHSGCHQTPRTLTVGAGPGLMLDAVTRTVYVANGDDSTLSMINAVTCNAKVTTSCAGPFATFPTSASPQGMAINHATHTLYLGNGGDDTLSAFNETTCNVTRTSGCVPLPRSVRVGLFPSGVAVDEKTNTVYTVNGNSNNVSIVNGATCNATRTRGCTRFPPTVAVGSNPDGVAVNNKTHTIYVANVTDNTVSVINSVRCNARSHGGCGQMPATVSVGSGPGYLAVDETTNTIYVPNSGGDNTVSVINGATCNATNTSGCGRTPPTISDPDGPGQIAVNPATHTVYVGNGDGTVSVIDGATCNGTTTTGCGHTPHTVNAHVAFIADLAVNPTTSTVYAADFHGGTVAVIDGWTCNATNTSGCGRTPTLVTLGAVPSTVGPSALDVDQRTNTVYVADCGRDPVNGSCLGTSVSVINGATCDATVTTGCGHIPPILTAGLGPYDVAIDQSTDAVYVVNVSDFSVTLINGRTCNAGHISGCRHFFPTIQVGGVPLAVEASRATQTAYVANFRDNNVSVFGPH
jgi:DNA-binding beta-propeller fold protein YncE